MMRGPGYRGKGLDTYSVETVQLAAKQRSVGPMGVWEEAVTYDGSRIDNSGWQASRMTAAGYGWLI